MRPIEEARKLRKEDGKKKQRGDISAHMATEDSPTFQPGSDHKCEKCGSFHRATADGTCPQAEVHARAIDELLKLQHDTVKVMKAHTTGDDIIEAQISLILNTLVTSSTNPSTSSCKAKKPDCFHWLRDECREPTCDFKHDPDRKGRDPEAGVTRARKGTDSTNDQLKDEPDKLALSLRATHICALLGCDKPCSIADADTGMHHLHCFQEHFR